MSESLSLPQFTLDDYETRFAGRHRLPDVVAMWAKEKPQEAALLAADGSRSVSWSDFDRFTAALAMELLRQGYGKGDFLLTMLPMSVDHVLLEYACFRIGVIVAPLDLRLNAAEVARATGILQPRGFFSLGTPPPFEIGEILRAASDGPEAAEAERAALAAAEARVSEEDGALVIFTTGSTGSPKPALLSHRNITVQNMCISGVFFGGDRGTRTLVNLPASHVGAQTEILMSTLFGGGTAILLELFDAARSLRAIAEHKVEILGQIPAMFNLEWMLKEYARYDLSSLRSAVYGGNAVSRAFMEKLSAMAPVVGTGLGLTEAAGFCTYVLANAEDHELILAGLGQDMPVYPCSIRQPMREDGGAGEELANGETGHVCFRGPQSFLGYVNDAEATAKTVSRDGYLYTGDLGFKDAAGLHLTGREKWVIKSMGYQIFPGDVEAHLCALQEKVAACVVVGVAHAVLSEAPVAVVEKRAGVELSVEELERHARTLPSYMRPRHWILLEAGKMPLNRVIKPDVLRIQEMARAEVAELSARGKWALPESREMC
jgi:acyl-CoA synthetase (AMP-forming)/AMP-acid ligase II